MKILTKKGHIEVSEYLRDLCEKNKGSQSESSDSLALISSDALLAHVKTTHQWWRNTNTAIKSLNFNLNAAENDLMKLDLVNNDKNLSDFRASLVIYNTLRELPPSVAVDWSFWSGLAFGACAEYMKNRWHVPAPILTTSAESASSQDKISDEETEENLILNRKNNSTDSINRARGILFQRWIGRGAGTTELTRHGIARLWWTARVADTAAKESEAHQSNKSMEHYLRILYANQNIQWSIVLRRYGAMPRLVSALLDKIGEDYLDQNGPENEPYRLAKGKSINEVKQFTKLLNTSAGGSLYDLKEYSQMKDDITLFQNMSKK